MKSLVSDLSLCLKSLMSDLSPFLESLMSNLSLMQKLPDPLSTIMLPDLSWTLAPKT